MANKKRDRNGYMKELGRYRLNRRDILVIEKLLRIYGDAKEMKHAGINKPPAGQKNMRRKRVDRHVSVGGYNPLSFGMSLRKSPSYLYDSDSIKFVPKQIKRTRYLEIACKPGITVKFTPFTTIINAQYNYATGKELRAMKESVSSIEEYLLKCAISFVNICNLERI